MRVYVPATLSTLPALLEHRELPPSRGTAVTPALREWYRDGDDEELEYAALLRAARQSVDLLADDVRAPRRRVVLAVDVPDGQVRPDDAVGPDDADDPAAVRIETTVPLRDVAAVHVDDEQSVPLVRAVLVEPDDEMAQGDLEDAELLWYATQEVADLLVPAPPG